MHEFLVHNDQLLPLSQTRLSPGQAGLLNGWGIFSTLRVYEGVPWAFERHWKRLARDADRVQIPLAHDPATVREAVVKVIGANLVQFGGILIYFVSNKGTPWHSIERLPT